MLFSIEWLRAICPIEADDEELARALTARGLTVDTLETEGVAVLDLDIPANRPDCLGHLGVARELSAAFGPSVTAYQTLDPNSRTSGDAAVEVRIEDPELCPRYTATIVRDVAVGSSPDWVRRRLEACGLRSINNAVDASNLVLLETGNPIHFFDLARLGDRTIVVRRAVANERLVTLDGVERRLDPDMLVIADSKRAIALAGVMGGADTEIEDGTTQVLIEAAAFAPASIRTTSRRLELQSDASHRFSRGVDVAALPLVQHLAIRLLTDVAGGTADARWVDCHPGDGGSSGQLTLRPEQLKRLLGFLPAPAEVLEALDRLGLEPEQDGEQIRVRPPSYRADLEREADLVEEVARHLGYDRIPSTMPEIGGSTERLDTGQAEESVRDLLASLGFLETYGYSMIGEDEDRPFVPARSPDPMRVLNPISSAMGWMRRSLLPGLLQTVDRNLRHGNRAVRLFEVARVFLDETPGNLPTEPLRVGLAWSGDGRAPHWSEPDRAADLFDMLGVIDRLLAVGRAAEAPTREASSLPGLHPGLSAHWTVGGQIVGYAGALHPELQQQFSQPVFLAEVNLGRLAVSESAPASYRPLPRVGSVNRDLAVVLPPATTYRAVIQALEGVKAPAPVTFSVIDRYEGTPLAPGEASLTVRITLLPDQESLTDDQIDGYRVDLVARLDTALGVRIRE